MPLPFAKSRPYHPVHGRAEGWRRLMASEVYAWRDLWLLASVSASVSSAFKYWHRVPMHNLPAPACAVVWVVLTARQKRRQRRLQHAVPSPQHSESAG